MQTIRTLTFDLDDTLWDNRPVMIQAEQALYQWLAEHYPRVAYRYSLADLRQVRMQLAAEQPDLRYRMTALRKQSLRLAADEVGYPEAMVEQAFGYFLEVRHRIPLYQDVVPGLRRLRQAGYLICALTNGNADVSRLGIGELFDLQLDAESVGEAKPHPRMFELACRRTGVNPAQLAHIGDEPEVDLAGANAAGVKAIWMNRLAREVDTRFPYHAEVRNMGELLALFGLDSPPASGQS